MHVTHGSERVSSDGREIAIWHLKLSRRHARIYATLFNKSTAIRPQRATISNEHDLAQTRRDTQRSMLHEHFKCRTARDCCIGELRLDAQVFCYLQARQADHISCHHGINIRLVEASISNNPLLGQRLVLQYRQSYAFTAFGFSDANDGYSPFEMIFDGNQLI